MQVQDVIYAALAVYALERAWFDGSIFQVWRERASAWRGMTGHRAVLSFLGHLLHCPLCLSFHLAFWLTLPLMFSESWRYGLMTLAVAGLRNGCREAWTVLENRGKHE